ncbi:hypothetical protein ACOBR2_03615 [Telmatobacter bradus]|uniref:hypothetical protein n=1 Tax=Telmatobacter bradus TaxID=474953 RepID=UPI003B431AEA
MLIFMGYNSSGAGKIRRKTLLFDCIGMNEQRCTYLVLATRQCREWKYYFRFCKHKKNADTQAGVFAV